MPFALPLLFVALTAMACHAPARPQELPRFERLRVEVGGAPAALLSLDADGDGRADLVVAGADTPLLLGDGSGFRPGPPFDPGPNAAGLAAADFDGDGRDDLVVANHESQRMTVLLAGEGGRLRPAPGSPVRVEVSPHPHAVVAGDMTGDGHADILVDDRDAHRLLLLAGDGRGSFAAPRPVPVGGDPYRDPWLGDLDGDGHLDVVTPNEGHLAVLLGDGHGGFAPAPGSPVDAAAPFAVTAADVNGDGVADLASLGDEGREGVTVLLGDTSGAWTPAPWSPVPGVRGPGRLAAGDIDGDGIDDLVAAPWPGQDVLLILGGDGPPATLLLDVGRNPWSVALADFDGDGRTDIAAAGEGSGDVTVLWNRGGTPHPP